MNTPSTSSSPNRAASEPSPKPVPPPLRSPIATGEEHPADVPLSIQLGHAGRKASTQRPWEGRGPLQAHENPWETLSPSGEPLTADCPDVADPEVGVTFVCTATTDDGLVINFGGIVDREDHIDVNSTNLITADQLPEWVGVVEDSITETVGFDVTVDCGDRFVVLDDESGMTCTAIDPEGITADVRLTNVDLDAGAFDWVIDG